VDASLRDLLASIAFDATYFRFERLGINNNAKLAKWGTGGGTTGGNKLPPQRSWMTIHVTSDKGFFIRGKFQMHAYSCFETWSFVVVVVVLVVVDIKELFAAAALLLLFYCFMLQNVSFVRHTVSRALYVKARVGLPVDIR